MKIRAKESFEQRFKNPEPKTHFGTIDYLQFKKNQVYNFYIIPKVTSIDLEADECEIDYPFEKAYTHFGVVPFMEQFSSRRPNRRINCQRCAIDKWMEETRIPKNVFKIAVPTEFYLAYVIHEKTIKIAWFQDYLYGNLINKISVLMTEKEINLIDAFRYRIRLFTDDSGKFDIFIEDNAVISPDAKGFKNALRAVNERPLDVYIEQNLTTDEETIDGILHALKDYTEQVIQSEKTKASREKLEERTQGLKNLIDSQKPIDYEAAGNEPITDGEPSSSSPDDDVPF